MLGCMSVSSIPRAWPVPERRLTWREAIDLAFGRRKWELDILREYDRTGRLPSRAEVEEMLRGKAARRAERAGATR